jgi:putative spermidine/putrescine transport system substrate-binding protein
VNGRARQGEGRAGAARRGRGASLLLLLLFPLLSGPRPLRAEEGLRLGVSDPFAAAALGETYLAPFLGPATDGASVGTWDGRFETLMRFAGRHTPYDVLAGPPNVFAAACANGLLVRLDYKALKGAEAFLPEAHNGECSIAAYAESLVLGWDRDKLHGTPNWADFWDVAKYPGRRGLARQPRGTLEIALLADGVAPADVYATLKTEEGLKRAFRKLDQLRPYVVWWQRGEEAVALLEEDKVLMTAAPSPALAAAILTAHQPLAVQWSGSLLELRHFAIPTGTPALAAAESFLASTLAAEREAALMSRLYVGTFLPAAFDLLPAETRPLIPTFPPNGKDVLPIDENFWEHYGPALEARFAAWLDQAH